MACRRRMDSPPMLCKTSADNPEDPISITFSVFEVSLRCATKLLTLRSVETEFGR